jgi:hypothetical protein
MKDVTSREAIQSCVYPVTAQIVESLLGKICSVIMVVLVQAIYRDRMSRP